MYDRVYTRIDVTRKYVDEMLLQNSDDVDRRTGYVHLYGVGLAAAIISLKRGHTKEYAELAEMAGLLHDYISYQGMDGPNHAHEGEPIVRKLLEEMGITSVEETEMICSAVYNHSDKNKIHSEFDEIIKDADVMQHWLRNPAEPLFREQERINKLCIEFGFDKFVSENYK
jgi:HD superfamily phosphodiesterase